MSLVIRKHVIDTIVEHAVKDVPIEACGYLAGNDEEITVAAAMKNMDRSPEHYSFDPQEQFRVVKDLRAKGFKVKAVYHSHPETPARMSAEDLRLAMDTSVSYVIVSLEGGRRVVKSFRVNNGCSEEETIEII